MKRDLDTFAVAAKLITQFIKASRYVVIVPENDILLFKERNLGKFAVVSEEKHNDIAKYLQKALGKGHWRFGWYFQQFIKLAELDEGNEPATNLVWDADTVPLKNIRFEHNNKIYFYKLDHYHLPYFLSIEKVFGFSKMAKNSFIAQCIPCKNLWIREFKNTIEARFPQKLWYEALIDTIQIHEPSGFSEYETLGTFILKYFPHEVEFCSRPWHRFGNQLIGGIVNLENKMKYLSKKYDFIAFEHWDNGKQEDRFISKRIKQIIKKRKLCILKQDRN